MEDDLCTLYAEYTEFVLRGAGDKGQGGARDQHRFSQHVWGSPLSFEQFQDRWKRICRDPALMQFWQSLLKSAASSHLGGCKDGEAA